MRLEGKVAISTGAASGIGRATAHRLTAEGAKVVIADINQEGGESCVEEIRQKGGDATFIKTDVSNLDELQNMVDFAVKTYGRLDFLHNNAYWTDAKVALETTLENWEKTLNVSLRPILFASKMAVPRMRETGGGVIVNTASVQSVVGVEGYAAYQAAKGGIMTLTRAMALELVPDVRVVAVLPGAINTPAVAISDVGSLDEFVADIPMKRLGEPEEIASTIAFLVSDDASYITGTGILVDGGYAAR